MSLGDPIGDMLTRIRNGQMRSLNKIEIPFSNFRSKILEVLKREGYIINYEITTNDKKIKNISFVLQQVILVLPLLLMEQDMDYNPS